MPEKATYEALKKRIAELEQKVGQFKYEAVKYRTLFESFPHGITVSDADGNILETNVAAEELLGVDKSEHERRKVDGPDWRIIRPDGSDMPPEEWASVIALKEKRVVSNCEMGIVKAKGQTTWINVTASPIVSGKNSVVVTYSDISEKKRAEDERNELKQRFHRFFESKGFYGYIISSDSTIIDVNEAALNNLGYTKEELLGKPLWRIYAV